MAYAEDDASLRQKVAPHENCEFSAEEAILQSKPSPQEISTVTQQVSLCSKSLPQKIFNTTLSPQEILATDNSFDVPCEGTENRTEYDHQEARKSIEHTSEEA